MSAPRTKPEGAPSPPGAAFYAGAPARGRRGAPPRPASAKPRSGPPAAPPAAAETAAAPPPKAWLGDFQPTLCALSDAELGAAAGRMFDALRGGRDPVPAGGRPHMVLTIGAPGSGKSTLAQACVDALGAHPFASYMVVDFDDLVRFHPRLNDIWHVPDMFGRPTEVGFAFGWDRCADFFAAQASAFLATAVERRFNVVVQSHWQRWLTTPGIEAYRTTLLYVGAPLEVATRRARSRAAATGKFLAPTLAAQDAAVKTAWDDYRRTAPWYALWADDFVAVANGDGAPPPSAADFLRVDPHAGPSWRAGLEAVETALAVVHGEKPRSALPPAAAAARKK